MTYINETQPATSKICQQSKRLTAKKKLKIKRKIENIENSQFLYKVQRQKSSEIEYAAITARKKWKRSAKLFWQRMRNVSKRKLREMKSRKLSVLNIGTYARL